MTKEQIKDYEDLKEAVEKAKVERESVMKIVNAVDGGGKVFSVPLSTEMRNTVNRLHVGMTIDIEKLLKSYHIELNKLIESV